MLHLYMDKIVVILAVAIFLIGAVTIFFRRMAVWGLVGQVISLKAIVACAFIFSQLSTMGNEDLAVLSLVVLGLLPLVVAVGILVLHRCERFSGTLDVEAEAELRN